MNTPIVDKVIEQLKTIPQELQWRVLEFTRALALSTPHGMPTTSTDTIPLDDVRLMREAIEQGCERIDANEWSIPTGHQRHHRPVRG